ncbi:hypothetical protein MPSEU_000509000 [Mayamaea pseudoterrestris]|nr:hypothetical protein MPSEU_000509000 [Mayamaea pseudoterrestris]
MSLGHVTRSFRYDNVAHIAKRRSVCKTQIARRRGTTSSASQSNSQSSSPSPFATNALSFGIGSLAGTAGSLAGMGGGFIMIPLMTSILKLSQHQAHATSLFAVTATGLAGAVAYGPDAVHLESAAAVAVCGMVSARWGANFTRSLSERTLKRALGVLMLAMAPIVPLKAYIMHHNEGRAETYIADNAEATSHSPHALHSPHTNERASPRLQTSFQDTILSQPSRILIPSCIGLCSGFLAGVFGVGGGVIVVPALTLASGSTMTHQEALATSLAAMVLPAAVGTMTHARAKSVAMRVAPALSIGALVGAYIGGKLAMQTNESTLRWGFSGLLATVGLRTIIKA